MRAAHALLLALLLPAIAGCADEPPTADLPAGDEPGQDDTPLAPTVADTPFFWAAGAAAPGQQQGQKVQASDRANVAVKETTARVNFTVTWTCATAAPACDLEAFVCTAKNPQAQRAGCASAGSGRSPLQVEARDLVPGLLELVLNPVGVDAGVTGTIHSEVREREPTDEDAPGA